MDRTRQEIKKILLVGNPNVGKSILFSRLTGVRVSAANYPGTTVEFLKGEALIDGVRVSVIDAPGIYSLEPSAPAEEVTLKLLNDADVVINVIDATNLERNLYLTTELLETNRRLLAALNMSDDLKHRGIEIDAARLEELLGVPVVPTSGITGAGIGALKEAVSRARAKNLSPRSHAQRWQEIGEIISAVQNLSHRHHTIPEFLEDASVNPWGGLVIGAAVMAGSFWFVRFLGEGLINRVLDPFFYNVYKPLLERLDLLLGKSGFWHNILIGKLIDGEIDFGQSMGLLTTAPYVEFVMVLPYVFAFYLLLSFLEDVGYIPRLALLLDSLMHRLGLHGFAIIPILLGFGCNVPGILATRVLQSSRERFIASTIISIGVPCAALQAMIFGVLGAYGGQYVAAVYLILLGVWLMLGLGFNYFLKGYSQELLLEVPPYRLPSLRMFAGKVMFRVKGFIVEALPIVLLSILIVNILHQLRLLDAVADLFAPVLGFVFGLPKEAAWALIIGFLRKDIAAGMLVPLDLNVKQLIIACVLLTMSFPCVATMVIFLKELGWKRFGQALLVMAGISVFAGGLLNMFLR